MAREECLASGPTGRSSAQLIPRSENRVIARLKWEGFHFYRNFEAHTGHSADFRTTGYLGIAFEGERKALEADLLELHSHGVTAELLTGREILAADEAEAGLYIREPGDAVAWPPAPRNAARRFANSPPC